MTKLHTTDEITSPFFPQEWAEYLTESGYIITVLDNRNLSYSFEIPFCFCVQVINDWVQLMVWNEQEPEQRYADWSQVHEFKGISSLTFFQWAMLLDLMGAVSVKQNFRKTNHINPSPFVNFSSRLKTAAL